MPSVNSCSPFVAVFMITYNHGKYISRAIGSVLEQSTSFPIKLFIGDDSSCDDTRQICKKFKFLHPQKIELLLHEKNIGAVNNALQVYRACFNSEAKYIAMLEGDDYWTDPLKLEKQVAFLETNEDFSICFHEVSELIDEQMRVSSINYTQTEFDINDLANGNFIHTSSLLFRNLGEKLIPPYYSKIHVGDFILCMHLAKYGKLKLLKENMAVYRIHNGGTWSTKSEAFIYEKIVQYLEYLCRDDFNKEVKKILNKRLENAYHALFSIKPDCRYIFKLGSINPILAAKLALKSLY